MAEELKLHIPYVVLREFQTQQRELYSKDLNKVISGILGLTKKKLSVNMSEMVLNIKGELEKDADNILSDAEDQIVIWAKKIGAVSYPLCIDQAQLALEAYFKGLPPLKSIKNREDIPDSFIVQSIHKLSEETKVIHVVANDIKVRESFVDDSNFITYESLPDFINSQLIQDKLKDFDVIENIGPILDALKIHENHDKDIDIFLSQNIGESVMYKTIADSSIPDDNNEATINSYGESKDIEIDFDAAKYYGNGLLGLPFQLTMSVYAYYYIFKPDYYSMDSDNQHVPSVADHNDHYFQAEDELEVNIYGLLSLTLNRDKINPQNISECIVEESLEIDEITEIELC